MNHVGRGSDQFNLRFPDGMRARIKALSERNHRSMNSEIVFQLANVLENQDETTTGSSLQAHPAAASENSALQGGASIHQG